MVLRDRLPSYLADPTTLPVFSRSKPGRISTSLRHAGKVHLRLEIQQKYRYSGSAGIWVR